MRFVAILTGLLFSSVAVADPTEKAIADIKDIAALMAAQSNDCGVVQMEKAIDYLETMSAIIQSENPDVDPDELMIGQIVFFGEAYKTADTFVQLKGCEGLNKLIEAYRYGMGYTDDIYYFYTELGVL